MGDEYIAARVAETPKASNTVDNPMSASPGITESLAALTLSTSSEDRSNSFRFPDMGERLTQWLEEELLGSPDAMKRSKSGENDGTGVGQGEGGNKLYVKLLASNAASGSIIGKMGVNIHHTQTTTGAKVQLSKPAQMFPGTHERTLLIRGNLCQLASAVYSIYIRLIEEDCAPTWSPRVHEDGSGDAGGRHRGEEGWQQSACSSSPLSSTRSEATFDDPTSVGVVETPEKEAEGRSEGRHEIAQGDVNEQGAVPERDHEGDHEEGHEPGEERGQPAGEMPIKEEEVSGEKTAVRKKTGLDLSEAVAKTPLQVKMLIPEGFIGYIVGRRGENVTNICETTHTSIKVFPQPHGGASLTHQIVSIRGHLVDIIKAISMIVLKQADDRDFYNYSSIPYTYFSRPHFGTGLVMPMYHPPGMVDVSGMSAMGGMSGMAGPEGLTHGIPAQGFHGGGMASPRGVMSQATLVGPSAPGGRLVSIMVPLLPEHQTEILENLGVISQMIQSSTGVLLKLESVPGQSGFCARLDGPREYVMMAANLLHSQCTYPTAFGIPNTPGFPMSPPTSQGTPSPFQDRTSQWPTP